MNPQGAFKEVQASLDKLADQSAGSRFARGRFMRLAGAGLFSTAVAAFLPRYADAHCGERSHHPCYGLPLCGQEIIGCENREAHCCSNTENRCSADCEHNQATCDNDGPSYSCWVMCHEGRRYRCCDCKQDDGDFCICRFQTGTC